MKHLPLTLSPDVQHVIKESVYPHLVGIFHCVVRDAWVADVAFPLARHCWRRGQSWGGICEAGKDQERHYQRNFLVGARETNGNGEG
jgi:hypothetical protein